MVWGCNPWQAHSEYHDLVVGGEGSQPPLYAHQVPNQQPCVGKTDSHSICTRERHLRIIITLFVVMWEPCYRTVSIRFREMAYQSLAGTLRYTNIYTSGLDQAAARPVSRCSLPIRLIAFTNARTANDVVWIVRGRVVAPAVFAFAPFNIPGLQDIIRGILLGN